MRALRQFSAALVLKLMLAFSAFAGDMSAGRTGEMTTMREGQIEIGKAGEMQTGKTGEMDTAKADEIHTSLAGQIDTMRTAPAMFALDLWLDVLSLI